MAKQLFGTDGIRGVAGEAPLDPRTVYAAGCALGEQIGDGSRVLVGMDTRESGPAIAAQLAGGLAARGCRSEFAGVLPTAAVSLLTEGGFDAGVMISASHNRFEDNGIKVFGSNGVKLADDIEAQVEDGIFRLLAGSLEVASASLDQDESFEQSYFQHLLEAGADRSKLKPMRLAVDCANGAAYRVAKRLFDALGMEADVFGDTPNGRNINLGCGSLHLDGLQQRVRETGADLGVAFDGDADRALFVADGGQQVDGDTVLLLGGKYLKSQGRLAGDRVVTTVMANMGLEKALEAGGISMERTAVGDKYVLEEMMSSGSALGGEQSGHIIFKEFANTGDGLLTARTMLEIISAAGEPLSVLRKQLKVFPQKLVNVRVSSKPAFNEVPVLAEAVGKAEMEMDGLGRVVVRYSGTEPLARIMVEAADQVSVDRHCEQLRVVFERELGV